MTSRLMVDKIEGKTTANTVQMPSGSIIQVQSTELLTGSQWTSTSSSWSDIISVTITPKFSSSKILFQLAGDCGSSGDNTALIMKLVRNINGGAFVAIGGGGFSYENNNYNACSLAVMDSPSTTNACIYKLQGALSDGGSGTAYFPTRWAIGDTFEGNTVTVMEIAQ